MSSVVVLVVFLCVCGLAGDLYFWEDGCMQCMYFVCLNLFCFAGLETSWWTVLLCLLCWWSLRIREREETYSSSPIFDISTFSIYNRNSIYFLRYEFLYSEVAYMQYAIIIGIILNLIIAKY